jgi:type I restriction enzyme R subunit
VDRRHTEDYEREYCVDLVQLSTFLHETQPVARIEHDRALARVIVGLMKDDTELFKQFSDNESFKKWLTDTVFTATYEPAARDRAVVSK